MSNIYLNSFHWATLAVSKLWFFESKILVSKSSFGGLQLMPISLNFKTLCCTFKTRGLGAISGPVCSFYYLGFKRNFEVFKSKSGNSLNKKVNFHENLTHAFGETNLVLQLKWKTWTENKTVMSWSSPKKESVFLNVFWPKWIFLAFVFYLNVWSIE